MSGSKEMKHYRMKETIRLFQEGKSREEIMEILGIAKSTVNVYLHNSGYSPKTNHRDNVIAVGRLADLGSTPMPMPARKKMSNMRWPILRKRETMRRPESPTGLTRWPG
jgi:DNA-binding CsgD family transcriptional regulator